MAININNADRLRLRGVVGELFTNNLPEEAKALTPEKADRIIDYFGGDEKAMIDDFYNSKAPKQLPQPKTVTLPQEVTEQAGRQYPVYGESSLSGYTQGVPLPLDYNAQTGVQKEPSQTPFTGFGQEITKGLSAGAHQLGGMVIDAPGFIYDMGRVASKYVNPFGWAVAKLNEQELLPEKKEFLEMVGFGDMKKSSDFLYNKAAQLDEEIRQDNPRIEEGITKAIGEGNISTAVRNLGSAISRNLAPSIGVMALGAIGGGVGAVGGATALFGSQQQRELEKDPDAQKFTKDQRTLLAGGLGAIEGLVERFMGAGAIGKATRSIMTKAFKEGGEEGARRAARKISFDMLSDIYKKTPSLAVLGEGMEESLTGILQDGVMKATGYKPDIDPFDPTRRLDEFLTGVGQGGVMSAPLIGAKYLQGQKGVKQAESLGGDIETMENIARVSGDFELRAEALTEDFLNVIAPNVNQNDGLVHQTIYKEKPQFIVGETNDGMVILKDETDQKTIISKNQLGNNEVQVSEPLEFAQTLTNEHLQLEQEQQEAEAIQQEEIEEVNILKESYAELGEYTLPDGVVVDVDWTTPNGLMVSNEKGQQAEITNAELMQWETMKPQQEITEDSGVEGEIAIEGIQPPVTQALPSEPAKPIEAAEPATYKYKGKEVDADFVEGMLEDADSREDIADIEIIGDDNLNALIEEKFPTPISVYRIGENEVSRNRILGKIEVAKTPDKLMAITIENDPELQAAVDEKIIALGGQPVVKEVVDAIETEPVLDVVEEPIDDLDLDLPIKEVAIPDEGIPSEDVPPIDIEEPIVTETPIEDIEPTIKEEVIEQPLDAEKFNKTIKSIPKEHQEVLKNVFSQVVKGEDIYLEPKDETTEEEMRRLAFNEQLYLEIIKDLNEDQIYTRSGSIDFDVLVELDEYLTSIVEGKPKKYKNNFNEILERIKQERGFYNWDKLTKKGYDFLKKIKLYPTVDIMNDFQKNNPEYLKTTTPKKPAKEPIVTEEPEKKDVVKDEAKPEEKKEAEKKTVKPRKAKEINTAEEYLAALEDMKMADFRSKSLRAVWIEPNYQELINNGLDEESAAYLHGLRAEAAFSDKEYNIKQLKLYSKILLKDKENGIRRINNVAKEVLFFERAAGNALIFKEVGHDFPISLIEVRLPSEDNKNKWTLSKFGHEIVSESTKEDFIEQARKWFEPEKKVRFSEWGEAKEEAKKPEEKKEEPKTEEKKEAKKTEEAKEEDKQKIERLEDFGEKIGGARKDLVKDYVKTLKEITDNDIMTLPLSKSWAMPNYQKMIDEGVNKKIVAFLRVMREYLPLKPKKNYMVRQWAAQVNAFKDSAGYLLEDGGGQDERIEKVRNYLDNLGYLSHKFASNVLLYEELGHDNSFKKYKVLFPDKIDKDFALAEGYSIRVKADTKEEFIEKLKEKFKEDPESTRSKNVKFSIYENTKTKDIYIGKNVGVNVIQVSKNFNTIQEAREYRRDNQEALEKELTKLKFIPDERNATNRERQGIDHLKGTNATPKEFNKTFGFRGVEFGNWVTTKERQDNLNNTYNALVDLASILKLPTTAISLNGELGMAFGARGLVHSKASAHYETDKIVINLTRKKGAGSLGHEWWHAVDNYFSRRKNSKDDFITERNKKAIDNTTRKEVLAALDNIVDTIKNNTKIKERSVILDSRRSKVYWSQTRELIARSFENYITHKLKDIDTINDYLANFKDTETFIKDSFGRDGGLYSLKDGYPYLLENEIPIVAEAFDKLFDVLETKESKDKPTVLFKRGEKDPTETEAFKRWFGDSKVVDENGKPLVVYHGTHEHFNEFNSWANSAFTNNKRLAKSYSDEDFDNMVMPLFLKIENPYIVEGGGRSIYSTFDINDHQSPEEFFRGKIPFIYDGIIFKNVSDPSQRKFFTPYSKDEVFDVSDVYMVRKPTQIKSVDNTGTFDPTVADIRFKKENADEAVHTGKLHLKFKEVDDIKERKQKVLKRIINKWNFWERTEGVFVRKNSPDRKPDYTSKTGSVYWYDKDGVYRKSNHWGANIGSNDWFLQEQKKDKTSSTKQRFKEDITGYAKWDKLIDLQYLDILRSIDAFSIKNIEKRALEMQKDVEAVLAGGRDVFTKGDARKIKKTAEKYGGYSFVKNNILYDLDFSGGVRPIKAVEEISKQKKPVLKKTHPNSVSLKSLNDNFKKWFGDSKIVDEIGNPLIAYHGTSKLFFEFKMDAEKRSETPHVDMMFFSDNKKNAESYSEVDATKREEMGVDYVNIYDKLPDDFTVEKTFDDISTNIATYRVYDSDGKSIPYAVGETQEKAEKSALREYNNSFIENSRVIDVFLKIENPYVIEMAHQSFKKIRWGELNEARRKGHDGIILKNIHDPGGRLLGVNESTTTYIVFDPTQIKSVNNVGTFDPSTADIRFRDAKPKSFKEIMEATVKENEANLITTKEISKTLSKDLGVQVNVVKDTIDLPEHIRAIMPSNTKVLGVFDDLDGSIYVVSKALKGDKGLIERTILHETVGHYGLRQMLGQQYNNVLRQVWNGMSQEVKEEMGERLGVDDELELADEYLSEQAELDKQPTFIQEAISKIREFLRKLFPNLKFNNAEILAVLQRSKKRLQDNRKEDNDQFDNYFALEDYSNDADVAALSLIDGDIIDQVADKTSLFKTGKETQKGFASIFDRAEERKAKKDEKALFKDKETTKKSVKKFMQLFREAHQDRDLPIRRFQEAIEDLGGKITPDTDPYNQRNRAFGRAEYLYSEELVKKHMDPTIKFMAEAEDRLSVDKETILPYQVAKHALERNPLMRQNEVNEWLSQQITTEIIDGVPTKAPKFITDVMIENERIKLISIKRKRQELEDKSKATKESRLKEWIDKNPKTTKDKLIDRKNKIKQSLTDLREKSDAIINKQESRIEDLKTKKEEISKDEKLQARIDKKYKSLMSKDYSGISSITNDPELKANPDKLAQDIVDEYEAKLKKQEGGEKFIDDLWNATRGATKFTLDQLLLGNQISKEDYDTYLNQYKYYIPLRGWEDAAEERYRYHRGVGEANGKTKVIKRAFGRTSMPADPLAYMEQMAMQSIAQRVDNESKQALLDLVTSHNDAPFDELFEIKNLYEYLTKDAKTGVEEWKVTTSKPSKEDFAKGEARKFVKNREVQEGVSELRTATKKERKKFYGATTSQLKEHDVVINRAGNTVVVSFPDELLTVAQAMNNQNNLVWLPLFGVQNADRLSRESILAKLFAPPTNFLKGVLTSLSLKFVARNTMRDVPDAYTTLLGLYGAEIANKAAKNYGKAGKAVGTYLFRNDKFSPETNKFHKYLQEFMESGAPTGFTHTADIDKLSRDIKRRIRKKRGKLSDPVVLSDKLQTALGLKGIENLAKFTEDTTRLAAFIGARESGKSIKESASIAKESSLNFNRKGKLTKLMDIWGGFVNPSFQAFQKGARLAKVSPKTFIKVSGIYITLGFLNAALNDWIDDEDYEKGVSEWMKKNYFVIPAGDRYITIPLSPFWRGLFSLGALTYDVVHGKKDIDEAAIEGLSYMVAGLSPIDLGGFTTKEGDFSLAPLVPFPLKPVAEVLRNRNFMGYTIAREAFTKELKRTLAESQLYKKNTGAMAKFISEFLFYTIGGGDPESKLKFRTDPETGEAKKVFDLLDINPAYIDHLIKGYTGGTGETYMDIMSTISTAFSKDEKFNLKEIPLLDAFVRNRTDKHWYTISKHNEIKNELNDHLTKLKENVKIARKAEDKAKKEKYFALAKVMRENSIYEVAKRFQGVNNGLRRVFKRLNEQGDAETAFEKIEPRMIELQKMYKLAKKYPKREEFLKHWGK